LGKIMDASSRHPEHVPAKHYAAMAVAVGRLRGFLDDVADGEFTREEVQRILDSTSLDAIAKAVGTKECDLAIDWNQYLTDAEKARIGFV
jgi:hypothetical protein